MGIKNLKNILVSKCSSAIVQRKLNSYNGLIIGIDLSIFLYKYLYRNNDHVEGLTRLILRLLKNNIYPVFVFDGKPPKEKDETLQDRKQKREFLFMKKEILELIKEHKKNLEKLSEEESRPKILEYINNYISSNNEKFKLQDDKLELYMSNDFNYDEEIDKISKKIITVKTHHIDSAKQLFDYFGVSYIHAPCEAESLLAVLSKKKIIDCCITEDMDILANGCGIFLKNFSADKNYVDEYCLEGILENLDISYSQFVDLCILCGCDYTNKIYGIGYVNAYKLIKKYDNIEGILENIKNISKFKVPDDFDYINARRLFNNPFDFEEIKEYICELKMKKPDIENLVEMLKATKLHEKHMKDLETNLMNYYLNITAARNFEMIDKKQSKITNYFVK